MNIKSTRHARLYSLNQLNQLNQLNNHCFLAMSIIKILAITGMMSFALTGCKDAQTDSQLQQELNQSEGQYGCKTVTTPFPYALCQVQQDILLKEKDQLSLQLFWRVGNDNTNKKIKPLYTFNALQQDLKRQPPSSNQNTLIFATNAGMYNQDFAPIGYTVIDGKQILSLNLKKGAGNFHLMPNGVFWWDENSFYITESTTMADMLNSGTKPIYATQSGPMLVINGKIHPKFRKNSESKKLRNGVGICEDGTIKLINTNAVVNFYELATLFKDELDCHNALFLDGGIASALYSPAINRNDNKNMGVMIGLVKHTASKQKAE